MTYLVDENDNKIMQFDGRQKLERGKPAKMTTGHASALALWKDSDNLHFENENGTWLDPFTLTEE